MPVHDATQITEHCPGGLRACCLSDVLDESRDIEPFDFIDLLLAHTGRDVPLEHGALKVGGSQVGRLAEVLVYDGSEGVFLRTFNLFALSERVVAVGDLPLILLRELSGLRQLQPWFEMDPAQLVGVSVIKHIRLEASGRYGQPKPFGSSSQ